MKILSVLFVLFFHTGVFAHAYYFGFAEMQYNVLNRTLETTLVLSAHDVEDAMKKAGEINRDLEFLVADSLARQAVFTRVSRDFQVRIGDRLVEFQLLGFEVLSTGLLQVYLLSEPVDLKQELHVRFSSLMAEFPEQQNKLTFLHKSLKYTAVFLPGKPEALIELRDEK